MLAPFALSLLLVSAAATLESCKNTDQLQLNTCVGPPEVYRVAPSEGKGLGMFSAHDLEVGDIVMREPPMLKIIPPETVKGSGYPMSAISRLVRHEFDQLPLVQQDEILSLTYHAVTPDEQDSADKLGLIFRTNAYTTGDEIGLFPKIARINHSCRPNTSYYWSAKLNRRVVYATRPIKKGEEFFVSYIPLLQTHTERQKRLDRYGFRCSCDACTQANAQQLASDDRRVTIGQAFKDFEPQLTLTPPQTAKGRQQAKKNAKASLELTELVHKEGLADYYAKAYRVAAISHARAKQWEPAAIWANKGFELKYLEDPESPYTMELHNMTSNFLANWEHELQKTRR